MEIINISLLANETKSFRKAGSYFEIISSTGPVGVSFYAPNAGQNNSIRGGMSGLYMNADYAAFDVQEQSGAAQIVQVLVCDQGEAGGSRRQPGNVRVVDEFFDSMQCQGFASNLAPKAFVSTAILLPSANLKGAIVRWVNASATSGATGTAACVFNAAKAAMTDFGVPNQRFPLAQAYSANQAVSQK